MPRGSAGQNEAILELENRSDHKAINQKGSMLLQFPGPGGFGWLDQWFQCINSNRLGGRPTQRKRGARSYWSVDFSHRSGSGGPAPEQAVLEHEDRIEKAWEDRDRLRFSTRCQAKISRQFSQRFESEK
jgi:hypothetical protein